MNFQKLADRYKTPLFAYDFGHIKSRYTKFKEAFSGRKSLILYAIKANPNLSVIKALAKLGAGADCVSANEIKRAKLAGIDKYKIVFSGVGKSDEEIEFALNEDILFINVESKAELKRVEICAKKLGKVARVSFRINPNIDPKTHPYISTGLHENKFGTEIEEAKTLYIKARDSEYLTPVALHFHIGSQLTELEPIVEATKIAYEFLQWCDREKIDIKILDVGGGLGIRYDNEDEIEPYDYAQSILGVLKKEYTIACEPGRYIVGNSGYFITKVLYEKRNDKKRFVIVDGAMNDLIRPSLYSAFHNVKTLKEGKTSLCDVVGPVCESGDFLAKNINLPELEHGDLVIIESAGAYAMSMSSNYNSRLKAAEIALENGEDRLIRKRDEFDEIVANEKEYL
jgi:diaminopimelate decarboxylase